MNRSGPLAALTLLAFLAYGLAGCATGVEDDAEAGDEGLQGGQDTGQDKGDTGPAPCPGHWHASFDAYADGTRVSFDHPNFTLEGSRTMPVATHMHRGYDWQWHFEPAQPACIPFADALAYADLLFGPDWLWLRGAHADLGQEGRHEAGGGKGLVAMHRQEADGAGNWTAIAPVDLAERQLRAGERVILAFGDPAGMDWDAWQALADSRAISASADPTDPADPA